MMMKNYGIRSGTPAGLAILSTFLLISSTVAGELGASGRTAGGITLTAPQGSGKVFNVGDTMTIEWTMEEDVSVPGLVIEVSGDGGKQFGQVTPLGLSGPAVSPGTDSWNNRSCRWVVEASGTNYFTQPRTNMSFVGDSCILMIAGYMMYSVSDQWGYFAIREKTASVRNANSTVYLRPSTIVRREGARSIRLSVRGAQPDNATLFSVNGRASAINAMQPGHFTITAPSGLLLLRVPGDKGGSPLISIY